jgi:hypothetical protein
VYRNPGQQVSIYPKVTKQTPAHSFAPKFPEKFLFVFAYKLDFPQTRYHQNDILDDQSIQRTGYLV